MPDFIKKNAPLAPLTTIQVGGSAAYIANCTTVEEVMQAVQWSREQQIDIHILGSGSNTIFPDEDLNRLVIKINLKGIKWGKNGKVTVQAGENWDSFVVQAITKNLAGVECMSGIPGSVGATPMQNVGAYDQEVSHIITEVIAINRETLKLESFSNQSCQFGYRTSRFKATDRDFYIITEVTFQLIPDGPATTSYPQVAEALGENKNPSLKEVRDTILRLRRSKSMIVDPTDPNTKSCGSFFMNPTLSPDKFEELRKGSEQVKIPHFIDRKTGIVTIPAAWLVENAGFSKGYEYKSVGISTNHPLAIINRNNGTSKEVKELAAHIQSAVSDKFNINLVIEPDIITAW